MKSIWSICKCDRLFNICQHLVFSDICQRISIGREGIVIWLITVLRCSATYYCCALKCPSLLITRVPVVQRETRIEFKGENRGDVAQENPSLGPASRNWLNYVSLSRNLSFRQNKNQIFFYTFDLSVPFLVVRANCSVFAVFVQPQPTKWNHRGALAQ